MEPNEDFNDDLQINYIEDDGPESRSAVNSLILNYYKKFGRKRDLEQFFSLSTAQNEIRDPSSSFWRRMKMQTDSSDSGEKPSESSTEICKISIRCSIPEESTSQYEKQRQKSESESPPIITEEMKHSDEETKSDGENSQKSPDATFDTSMNKPLSPTSSITSQRKLEWDSLADVGYANETDRTAPASGLSTLERLALIQQYTNSDKDNDLGPPTAHSTLIDKRVDNEDGKSRKKQKNKNIKEIHAKDVDVVELNVPQASTSQAPQSFSVNVTKHISFNMEKGGQIMVEQKYKEKEVTVNQPEKENVQEEGVVENRTDKEIQTSFSRANNRVSASRGSARNQIPVFISLNTLKRRMKRRNRKNPKKKNVKKSNNKVESTAAHEKSGDPVSEAESFEYMPGHIYNQNQMQDDHQKTRNSAGNKSSLESSGITTESSKTINSFTKDLEKSIKLLNAVLKRHHDDSEVKKKLVKEVVKKLLHSKYRDDESSTDFLSGLSLSSKRLGNVDNKHYTTTSTSDNNTQATSREKKSILRLDKFNSKAIASTSQSTPNLPSVSNNEKPLITLLKKHHIATHTDSDMSSKEKESSDTAFAKTSSEELYQKYVEAVRREENYKRHLREKEKLLKQKLVRSEQNIRPVQPEIRMDKLKALMKDLTRNNYDDGSGDASKLEGGSNLSYDDPESNARRHRSHSVFTLSSGNSERMCSNNNNRENRRLNLRRQLQDEIKATTSRDGKEHYCCCPHHGTNLDVADSSVQVTFQQCENKIGSSKESTKKCNSPRAQEKSKLKTSPPEDNKITCLCKNSSFNNNNNQPGKINKKLRSRSNSPTSPKLKFSTRMSSARDDNVDKKKNSKKSSQSSQTNVALNMLGRKHSGTSACTYVSDCRCSDNSPDHVVIHEITRCVQTEISIDPRIPDPTLSDINILSDKECAFVVSETYRKIFKYAMKEDNASAKKVELKSSSTQIGTPCICRTPSDKMSDDEIQYPLSERNESIPNVYSYQPDTKESEIPQDNANDLNNYVIPLQGTNMTLMVSIGNNTATPEETDDRKHCHAVETDTVETADKATSLDEECTKTVQSQSKSVVKMNQTSPRDENSNKIADKMQSYESKFSTYPAFEKKQFLRTNTDPAMVTDSSNYEMFKSVGVQINDTATDPPPLGSGLGLGAPNHFSKPVDKIEKNRNETHPCRTNDVGLGSAPQSDSGSPDPLLNVIKDITRRYSKNDNIGSDKRKKCYKEIMSVLSYLLDTEENIDSSPKSRLVSTDSSKDTADESAHSSGKEKVPDKSAKEKDSKKSSPKKLRKETVDSATGCSPKKLIDRAIQLTQKRSRKKCSTDSSEAPASSDMPGTSSDSATCKVLNKIKKECEKYHQKRCKSCHKTDKQREDSSSSVNDTCRRVPCCSCKTHKQNKGKTTIEKVQKKCVAYNLILQSSDSMKEQPTRDKSPRQLKDVVVKVPSRKCSIVPDYPLCSEVPRRQRSPSPPDMSHCQPYNRSRSLPNESEISSTDDYKRAQSMTVRDYLARNRPDFIENTSDRQSCLKMISESRASERAAQKQLLSLQLEREPALSKISSSDIRRLAEELGLGLRRRKVPPKFISEREMKKHSERIYKSLPEVTRRKEEMRKESIRRTNLLMASIFKKNLQKKTLRGSVNISNYSAVIKI